MKYTKPFAKIHDIVIISISKEYLQVEIIKAVYKDRWIYYFILDNEIYELEEKEILENLSKKIVKKRVKATKFKKPSYFEVNNYIKENKLLIEAKQFIDYYESKGWLIGKSPMKDWKATLRNWNRKNSEGENNTKKQSASNAPHINIDNL